MFSKRLLRRAGAAWARAAGSRRSAKSQDEAREKAMKDAIRGGGTIGQEGTEDDMRRMAGEMMKGPLRAHIEMPNLPKETLEYLKRPGRSTLRYVRRIARLSNWIR